MKELKEYEERGCVFKRCKDYVFNNYEVVLQDCIVIMKKPLNSGFKCNEFRKSVINKKFAKFRGNQFITIAIYDLISKKFISSLFHHFRNDVYINYEVNKLSIPNGYNKDINVIRAQGIHYFLTLEATLLYQDGKMLTHDDNGKELYKA
jgi:hypothetical protein